MSQYIILWKHKIKWFQEFSLSYWTKFGRTLILEKYVKNQTKKELIALIRSQDRHIKPFLYFRFLVLFCSWCFIYKDYRARFCSHFNLMRILSLFFIITDDLFYSYHLILGFLYKFCYFSFITFARFIQFFLILYFPTPFWVDV